MKWLILILILTVLLHLDDATKKRKDKKESTKAAKKEIAKKGKQQKHKEKNAPAKAGKGKKRSKGKKNCDRLSNMLKSCLERKGYKLDMCPNFPNLPAEVRKVKKMSKKKKYKAIEKCAVHESTLFESCACMMPIIPLEAEEVNEPPPDTNIIETPKEKEGIECYVEDGLSYRGSASKTKHGLDCQNWLSQEPHEHTRTPDNYPDTGLGDHNYCRNPDGELQPWCYTTDPVVRWQHCEVPRCSEDEEQQDNKPEPEQTTDITYDCYEEDLRGFNYRGEQNKTKHGLECQNWLSQEPHEHIRTPDNYPDTGLGDHNYCRNPDGELQPWCYTTDPEVRFQYCEIPRCTEDEKQQDNKPGTEQTPGITYDCHVVGRVEFNYWGEQSKTKRGIPPC